MEGRRVASAFMHAVNLNSSNEKDILVVLKLLWLLQAGHVNFSQTSWPNYMELSYCLCCRGCHLRKKPSKMGSRDVAVGQQCQTKPAFTDELMFRFTLKSSTVLIDRKTLKLEYMIL